MLWVGQEQVKAGNCLWLCHTCTKGHTQIYRGQPASLRNRGKRFSRAAMHRALALVESLKQISRYQRYLQALAITDTAPDLYTPHPLIEQIAGSTMDCIGQPDLNQFFLWTFLLANCTYMYTTSETVSYTLHAPPFNRIDSRISYGLHRPASSH